ncbi:MAG: pitrilysin family protein, partial [Elusimicrobiota bacterium]
MRLMFASLVVAILMRSASAQEISRPRLTVLDNGLRVITVEDHKSPLISAVWSAHVGDSAAPPEFGGNSHYLEHLLLFRGTEKYPGNAIGDRVSGSGGYFNGHTWYDWTTFEITMSSDRLDEVLDMHEQMMFHAAFAGKDFETEKKAVFEELRSGEDKPYFYLWRKAPYGMYDADTYYSRDTIGTIAKVQAATVERVRAYYRDYYVPNNMTFVLVGNFDTEAALARIRARLGSRPAGKAAISPYQPLHLKGGTTVVSEERKIGKAYFLAAFEGPQASSPDFAPYQVLIDWLSSGKT